MSEVYHAEFTPQELAEILQSLFNTARLLKQHRKFLLNVLGNYMTEKEYASIRKLLDEQLDANAEKCAKATAYLEREDMRSRLANMEGNERE
jgi:hypothetical protein